MNQRERTLNGKRAHGNGGQLNPGQIATLIILAFCYAQHTLGAQGDLLLSQPNPSPAAGDNFGRSVASTLNGDLLVGSFFDDTGATDAGSAYLLDGRCGDVLLTINNPTPAVNDRFGYVVAATPDGDLLVGAPLDDTGATNAGVAYLFDGTHGNLLLTLNNPTPANHDNFGITVATTPAGDLLVGAYGDSTGAVYTGSAYLFDGTTGSLLLTLNNPTPEFDDRFGFGLAATPEGDILVGAFNDNTGAPHSGSAYLFDGTTGSLLLTINNPTPAAVDLFGYAVAATPSGDLLVGAYFDDTGATNAGSAYLFDGSTGSLVLTLNNPDPAASDHFGISLATTPNGHLLIGTVYEDTGATDTGSAYLLDGACGSVLLTLNNPEPAVNDYFGVSVASAPNGDLLVGAYFDDAGATDGGSIYVFEGITVRNQWTAQPDTNHIYRNTGNVGIGTANPATRLHVDGIITETSDQRLKTNIAPLLTTLAKIDHIEGVRFEWKDKKTHPDRTHIGVIAQNIEAVYPELVFTANDKLKTKSVNYDGLIAVLVEAVKELSQTVDHLQDQIHALEQERGTETRQIKARLSRGGAESIEID